MTYRTIYDGEYYRTIPSCIIDDRVNQGLGNAIGSVIQAFIDDQLSVIHPGVLTYKIETLNGNLAAVFGLNVHPADGATVVFKVIRLAFQEDISGINTEISNFIEGNDWKYDI